MVMRAIQKNKSLYERSDVKQATLEISELLSSGSSREERIKVSQLRPHFEAIVAAESEVVQERNERIDGLLAKAQQPSTLASQAIVDRFIGGLELYTHEGKVHSHLSNLYGSCNYYLTEPGERKPMLGKARLIVVARGAASRRRGTKGIPGGHQEVRDERAAAVVQRE